jgi:hypothetical protein
VLFAFKNLHVFTRPSAFGVDPDQVPGPEFFCQDFFHGIEPDSLFSFNKKILFQGNEFFGFSIKILCPAR